MTHNLKELTDFLVGLGVDKVPHSKTYFLSHLIGVYRDLKEWGAPEHLALAGLFHSIYGTEAFQGFRISLDRREEVRSLIGERAERLAYANCALTRDSLDASVLAAGRPNVWDRFRNAPLEITDEDYADLLTLHLCDRLEQVERSQNWDLRSAAFRGMAERLGGVALETWTRVFAGARPAAA